MTASGFDYIVVGAGTAGCVMASRLSERPSASVLLLEAGSDYPPGSEPKDMTDAYAASYFNPAYFWPGLKAHWRNSGNSPLTALPQGCVIGGGGSVMGMVALRGTAADYDAWAQDGAHGWAWSDVLPYFCKLESDWDFRGDCHGSEGPLPIRRLPRAQWPPLAVAVEGYGRERGLALVEDMNADFRDGCAVVPMSTTYSARASSALCYLDVETRARSNLSIVDRATVTRILFQGRRAVGVAARIGAEEREFRAREVILAAGAIFSPTILLRSGIGPAQELQNSGIAVVADLPGVGANLQNHPTLYIGLHLERNGRQPASLRTVPAVSVRFSSGLPGCPPHDLYVNVQSKTSWNALGRSIGNAAPTLLKPASRGRVALSASDPLAYPRVTFDFLAEDIDLQRLMHAFAFTVQMLGSAHVRPLLRRAFPLRYDDRIRRLNARSTANAWKSRAVALLLDAVPQAGDWVFSTLSGNRVDLAALAADPVRLAEHVRENVSGVFHPVGTCRMGSASDGRAVVDTQGRVRGIDGLRVADASIMPTIVAGNTNLPTMMIAEKIAATVLEERQCD